MVEIEADANGRAITWMMPAADGGEVTLIAKTIDGSFPDYARVIPQGHPNTLTIARDMLAAAIKRVATVAESKTRIVKLDLAKGLATVSSASTDIGEASEDLAAEYTGAAMTVGFDSRYWRDALGAVATDKVVMRFSDAGAPVLIEAEATGDEVGLVQVLMPVRV
jgi:DNA polymerase-3 subunit beta